MFADGSHGATINEKDHLQETFMDTLSKMQKTYITLVENCISTSSTNSSIYDWLSQQWTHIQSCLTVTIACSEADEKQTFLYIYTFILF